MTLHASKGLEFSHVFITGVNYGLIPLQTKSFEEEEEEQRLFFVWHHKGEGTSGTFLLHKSGTVPGSTPDRADICA